VGRVVVTTVSASDCTGLWRRTLLINADGSRDERTDVVWLQGISAYVDSQGFAGRLRQDGGVFEWGRDIDLEPPGPHPDAGAMRWDGHTLVETGVHEDYTERWDRDDGPTTPAGAMVLTAPDGAAGLLVRVGERFGWADGGLVVIDTVGGSRWCELDVIPSDNELRANGVRWAIKETEGFVNL
jgi:hypothetical protein